MAGCESRAEMPMLPRRKLSRLSSSTRPKTATIERQTRQFLYICDALVIELTFWSRGWSETVARRRMPEAAPPTARVRAILPRTCLEASMMTMCEAPIGGRGDWSGVSRKEKKVRGRSKKEGNRKPSGVPSERGRVLVIKGRGKKSRTGQEVESCFSDTYIPSVRTLAQRQRQRQTQARTVQFVGGSTTTPHEDREENPLANREQVENNRASIPIQVSSWVVTETSTLPRTLERVWVSVWASPRAV